jgi:hypothetical protein
VSARITVVLAVAIIFWLSGALIVWTQVGYPAALAVIARAFPAAGLGQSGHEPRELAPPSGESDSTPSRL